jgi:hypothetical protein
MTDEPTFWRLAVSDGTPLKALKVALVVGTLLALINQTDLVLAGQPPSLWKLILTYLVPYCVSTWAAVGAKRAFLRTIRE